MLDEAEFIRELRAVIALPYYADAYEVFTGDKPDLELSRDNAAYRLAFLSWAIIGTVTKGEEFKACEVSNE